MTPKKIKKSPTRQREKDKKKEITFRRKNRFAISFFLFVFCLFSLVYYFSII